MKGKNTHTHIYSIYRFPFYVRVREVFPRSSSKDYDTSVACGPAALSSFDASARHSIREREMYCLHIRKRNMLSDRISDGSR